MASELFIIGDFVHDYLVNSYALGIYFLNTESISGLLYVSLRPQHIQTKNSRVNYCCAR